MASLTVSLLFLPCAFVLFPPTTLLQSKDFFLPWSFLSQVVATPKMGTCVIVVVCSALV